MLSRDSDELSFLARGRSPSPCPEDRTSPNGRIDFCDYVVEEILVTEQQYVRDLEDIVEGYLEYSRTCLHITDQDINDIFSNIEDIYNFHISFLKDLECCDDQPVAIAKCFTNRGAEFDIYAKYVTNYPSSIASLTSLIRKAVINDAYRKQQLILGHGLPLGSYLHKPVQRILKYHLLLQNMLKHFGEETVGRDTLSTALQCMTDCAHNINELKRSHEHAMKIQEIQSTLYNFEGYHLMDFGKLVHEGDLRMHGAKSFRHIYLFEKGVIICKKREDGAMSCKTTIMCHNLMLIESVPREPLSFHLVPFDNPRQQNTFQAKTLEQKREWCNMVKKYMLENFDVRIPEKAKELLLTLTGKSEADGKTAKHFKAFTLKPHQTPDYIDRRRRSQPFVSLSGGGTLPRTKKRVRKVSADPVSLLTSPPTTRMSRSMSAPIHPDLLSLATTCSTDLNVSDLLPEPNSLHAESNYNGANGVNGVTGNMFCDIIEETVTDNDVNGTTLEDENANVYPETNAIERQLSIPTVQVRDQDSHQEAQQSEMKDLSGATASQQLVDGKGLHVPCSARFSMPKSAAGTSRSSLFSTSAVSTPCLLRRHSLSDLKSNGDKTESEEQVQLSASPFKPKSYDELSDRAHVLQRLMCERNGFDNPIWSPEIVCLARRYRTVLVKRADSYSEAVMQSTTLAPRAQSEASLSYDSGDLLGDSSRNSSVISDVSYQDGIDEREHHTVKHPDGATLRRGKTETSLILNKLTQLKEKTSSKLSDLLKKSPVKLFRDGEYTSQNIDYTEPHGSQSAVGRRLSNSDAILADGLSLHRPIFSTQSVPEDVAFSDNSPTDSCRNMESELHLAMPCIATSESEVTLLAGAPEPSDSQPSKDTGEDNNSTCDTPLPPLTYRNRPVSNGIDRDSTISLTSTNGETLERNANKQGYSSENLADVEENDYENIGYGDHDVMKATSTPNEPIYSTIDGTERVDEVTNEDEDSEVPPALPPLPEFLIKRRLAKTKSCGDVIPVNDLNNQRAANDHRMSVPNNIKLNTPTSDFWVALEKYMETGEVENTAQASHRPIRDNDTYPRVPSNYADVEPNETAETQESESQVVFTPRRSSAGPNHRNNNVLKMARKYSTRIKKREEVQRKLRGTVPKVSEDGSRDDHSTSCTSDGASERRIPPRRVSSIRLRRTNSERIKRFQVILDSDDEYGTKLDSGAPQCDIDSGSDCNDIYEKQTMAALESFASDDDMRDSAIYSDGEDIGVITLTSPTKFRYTRKASAGKTEIADGFELETRRSQSFSRSHSLPNRKVEEQMFSSVVDLVSRPVSSSLVVRLEALKCSSTFEKENSTDSVNQESSVQHIAQNLKDQSTKTFIRQCSIPVVTNNETALVSERQKQLSKTCRKLVRQQSTDTIPIDPGLVQNVKEKLQAT